MSDDRSGEAGSVSTGIVGATEPGPEIRRLEVFIGRWLTEGHVVGESGAPGSRIVASDVCEWAPGGFFVVHPAYGRIAEVGVGGHEVIGYDPATGAYRTHFFDSQGNTSGQTLTPDGDQWVWLARPRAVRAYSATGVEPWRHITSAAPTTGAGCRRWRWS